MELRLLERDEKNLRVEVVNPDDTVIYPLIRHLLQDERVEDARYVTGHAHLDKPHILLLVREGRPEAVLKEAALALSAAYGQLREHAQGASKGAS